ncbi:hypothetical protein HDU81_001793, partial [Chytriomyces hyalinus]
MPDRTVMHLIVIATQICQRANLEENLPREDCAPHKRIYKLSNPRHLNSKLKIAYARHPFRQQQLLFERARSLRTFIDKEIRKEDVDDVILRETAMQMYHVFYAVPYAVTPDFMDEAFATLGFHVSPNDGLYFGA